MGNPTYDNSLAYVVSVEAEIRRATSKWKEYGYAASKAYSQAYNDQGEVLSKVGKNLEQLRKREEQVASLALTIFTVGIAGPLAAEVTTEVFEKGADVVKEQWVHLVNIGLEHGAELAAEHLGSSPSEELFKPAGIPPDQYGDELQEAIETRTSLLEDIVLDFLRKGSAGMKIDRAKALYDVILKTEFVQNPPVVTDRTKLRKHARFALWLAWLWARDLDYWKEHSNATHYRKELQSFEPVRLALDEFPIQHWEQDLYVEPHNEGGIQTFSDQVTLIDMEGYIEWSFRASARAALFAGIPSHPAGRKYAENQMAEHFLRMFLQRMGYFPSEES